MLPPFAVLMPAAGKSSRFGGKEKKPFVNLDGRAIWLRTAEVFVNRPEVKQLILIIAPEDMEVFKRRFAANVMFLNITLVEGGAERFESVANALEKLVPEVEYIAVHDAVRPCVPATTIDAVFQAAVKHGAALPGLPIAETIKQINESKCVEATIPRQNLWLAQTPQAFRRSWLLDAYAKRSDTTQAITDDAQLIESLGHKVHVVNGSPLNLKITTSEDLHLAEMFIRRKSESSPKPQRAFDEDWMK